MAQSHSENDIREAIKYPYTMIQSDFYTVSLNELVEALQHPRCFGTFPLLFRKYVRGETRSEMLEEEGGKILSLEEAVRRITYLPAKKLGLKGRGLIREGFFADIVIFNEDKIQDMATYKNPNQYAKGVEYVIVNGEIVIDKGKHTDITPGRVIKRGG